MKNNKPPRFYVEDVTVNSVADMINFVHDHKNDFEIPNKKTENLNKNFFRGESEDFGNTSLFPKVFRSNEYKRYETDILLELISIAPEVFSNKSTFEQLVLAQHYGAPTRLLDITSNPLIALFFACENYSKKNSIEKDGFVFRFIVSEPFIFWSNSKEVSFLSNLAKLGSLYGKIGGDYKEHLQELIEKAREYNEKNLIPDTGTDSEIEDRKKLIDYCSTSKIYNFLNENEFNAVNANVNLFNIENVICVRPQNIDPRITNQSAYFLLFGENTDLNYFEPSIVRIQKIIIPAKRKKRILEDLQVIGISPINIYPDIYTKSKFMNKLFENKKDYFFEYGTK